jgi:uncharacterized membrane protein
LSGSRRIGSGRRLGHRLRDGLPAVLCFLVTLRPVALPVLGAGFGLAALAGLVLGSALGLGSGLPLTPVSFVSILQPCFDLNFTWALIWPIVPSVTATTTAARAKAARETVAATRR